MGIFWVSHDVNHIRYFTIHLRVHLVVWLVIGVSAAIHRNAHLITFLHLHDAAVPSESVLRVILIYGLKDLLNKNLNPYGIPFCHTNCSCNIYRELNCLMYARYKKCRVKLKYLALWHDVGTFTVCPALGRSRRQGDVRGPRGRNGRLQSWPGPHSFQGSTEIFENAEHVGLMCHVQNMAYVLYYIIIWYNMTWFLVTPAFFRIPKIILGIQIPTDWWPCFNMVVIYIL